MNRWRIFMLIVGVAYFLLWASVCFHYTDLALSDEDSGGRLKPAQFFVFGPLAAHIFYIVSPLARVRYRFSFLIGTPLHIPMLGFLLLAVRYSLWPLFLLIGPVCWILYLRALLQAERANGGPVP